MQPALTHQQPGISWKGLPRPFQPRQRACQVVLLLQEPCNLRSTASRASLLAASMRLVACADPGGHPDGVVSSGCSRYSGAAGVMTMVSTARLKLTAIFWALWSACTWTMHGACTDLDHGLCMGWEG